jgi:hypothetical protein
MNRSAIHAFAAPATPERGVVVRNPWARNLLTFLMVFGPGLIVMEADNDAGAVSTYIQAGAQYGLISSGCSSCYCPLPTSFRKWLYGWGSPPVRDTQP